MYALSIAGGVVAGLIALGSLAQTDSPRGTPMPLALGNDSRMADLKIVGEHGSANAADVFSPSVAAAVQSQRTERNANLMFDDTPAAVRGSSESGGASTGTVLGATSSADVSALHTGLVGKYALIRVESGGEVLNVVGRVTGIEPDWLFVVDDDAKENLVARRCIVLIRVESAGQAQRD